MGSKLGTYALGPRSVSLCHNLADQDHEVHYSYEWNGLTRAVALIERLRNGAQHILWGHVWYRCDHPMDQYIEDHH